VVPTSPGGVAEADVAVFGTEGVAADGAGAIGGGWAVAGAEGAAVEDGGVMLSSGGLAPALGAGAIAPVFTPAPVADVDVTERSGEAATVVERVARWRTVVVLAGVVATSCVAVVCVVMAAGGVSGGGVVLAASVPAFGVIAVAGVEPAGTPGVIWAMPELERVAYQPAAASAASTSTPTTIAAGAIEPRRAGAVRGGATIGSPVGLIASSRSKSASVAAAPVAIGALGRARAPRRRRLLLSQIGVGANIEASASVFAGSFPGPRV